MTNTLIPPRMSHLELDQRGYPIPWVVYRDKDNRPHFQINDDKKRYASMALGVCGICAHDLLRGRWFVGGPISAFHEHGAFADPPMHYECAQYALAVCPYLAMSRYNKRVDDKTLGGGRPTLLINSTMIDRRPDVFVCAMSTRQRLIKGPFPNVVPGRPFVRVEYWRNGKQLSQGEGEALVEADRLTWKTHIASKNKYATVIMSKRRS
jgi:hypothetical protein